MNETAYRERLLSKFCQVIFTIPSKLHLNVIIIFIDLEFILELP